MCQPLVLDIPSLGFVHPPRYIFKSLYVKDACQRQDENNEGHTMETFIATSSNNLVSCPCTPNII